MEVPRFNLSINDLNKKFNSITKFTYSELNIDNFIVPAVYKKIIGNVYWIRTKHLHLKKKSVRLFVRSFNKGGKCLIKGEIKQYKNDDLVIFRDKTDLKEFNYYLRTIEQIPSNKKVILDIDLDYFSCSGNPYELEPIYVEITKDEYEDYINNKYHRLNYINLGKRIDAIKLNKKYFYLLNKFNEIYPSKKKVDKQIINQRIEELITNLKKKHITPVLIDICRSRYSGFTPKEQWKYIEKKLIRGLKSIYNIELLYIDQLKCSGSE